MNNRLSILGLGVVAACLIAGPAAAQTLLAISPPVLDLREGDVGLPRALGLDTLRPDVDMSSTPQRERSGNPLWDVPFKSLMATRERPIFLPSRRAPVAAVPSAPSGERAKPRLEQTSAEPESPQLTLVGAITSNTEGIAVFIDDMTHDVIRLKTGEGHEGWILRSVEGREVTLEKDRRTTVLVLPSNSGERK